MYTRAWTTIWGAQNVRCTIVYANMLLGAQKMCTKVSNFWRPGKDTHNDLYLHWNSSTPISWKRGTLKLLISRAYMVCSNETLLEKELNHLKHVFQKINGHPWWVIDQVRTPIQESINKNKSSEITLILQNNLFKKCTLWSCHMLDLKVTL